MQSFEKKENISIQTTSGKISTRQIIFATHIPPGINMLHFEISPYRSYVITVKLKNNDYPDKLIYDMIDPYHFFRTHEKDGQKYLIVGGEDHKTGHDEHTGKHFDNLEKYLTRYFEIQDVTFKWSSQYYESGDGLAYIGLMPGYSENVFVATGFGGNGMTYSHISSNLLNDLILNGKSSYSEAFNPGRIKPASAYLKIVKENADVIKEFVKKRISVKKIETPLEVKSGEGKVIKYEGSKIAMSRNGDKLHALDPVCPHAKCIVQWNETEKSWDCPCHGARYNNEGEVLNGPSTFNLDQLEVE